MINANDIVRVAQRLLSTPPSVAARGRLGSMRTLKHVSHSIRLEKYIFRKIY